MAEVAEAVERQPLAKATLQIGAQMAELVSYPLLPVLLSLMVAVAVVAQIGQLIQAALRLTALLQARARPQRRPMQCRIKAEAVAVQEEGVVQMAGLEAPESSSSL